MAETGVVGGLFEQAGINLPNFSGIGSLLLIILVGLVFAGGSIFAFVLIMNNMKWNRKVKLFRKVANRIIPVVDDKAKMERIGAGGDLWLQTKKLKKTLPRPKIEMDKNTYYYYEREDGEWINFEIADIDELMKKAGVYYVDEDMRLQRLGIQKNLQARLMKETFWQKYGNTIMMILFVLIVTICLVVLFQKMTDNWKVASETAKAIEHMAVSVSDLAQRIGGGVTPASTI
jgi:hypothetical protein